MQRPEMCTAAVLKPGLLGICSMGENGLDKDTLAFEGPFHDESEMVAVDIEDISSGPHDLPSEGGLAAAVCHSLYQVPLGLGNAVQGCALGLLWQGLLLMQQALPRNTIAGGWYACNHETSSME